MGLKDYESSLNRKKDFELDERKISPLDIVGKDKRRVEEIIKPAIDLRLTREQIDAMFMRAEFGSAVWTEVNKALSLGISPKVVAEVLRNIAYSVDPEK